MSRQKFSQFEAPVQFANDGHFTSVSSGSCSSLFSFGVNCGNEVRVSELAHIYNIACIIQLMVIKVNNLKRLEFRWLKSCIVSDSTRPFPSPHCLIRKETVSYARLVAKTKIGNLLKLSQLSK